MKLYNWKLMVMAGALMASLSGCAGAPAQAAGEMQPVQETEAAAVKEEGKNVSKIL